MSTNTTTNTNGKSARQMASKASIAVEVKPDLIRRRAYEIFLSRNGGPGDHVSDWIQAEQELCAPRAPLTVAPRSERRGSDSRPGRTSQPIRDGILDNR